MQNCLNCKYCRAEGGGHVCDKIAEKLLGLKGCGHFQQSSPFDMKHCPTCGKAVVDGAHAIHECVKEG